MYTLSDLVSICYIHVNVGFRDSAGSFFIYLLTLILTSTAASGVAFFFSALVNVFALANILTTFTYVIMMVSHLVCIYRKLWSGKIGDFAEQKAICQSYPPVISF